MNKLTRFAMLGATTALALGLGFASAPASASVDTAPVAMAAPDGDYTIQSWHWIFAYLSLAECQSAGQEYVDDPTTPWTDWYCNPRFVSGYWFYDLYLWQY
jgi:hypothetical protein